VPLRLSTNHTPILTRRHFLLGSSGAWLAADLASRAAETTAAPRRADVCVYGGNASGVMAAVAAAREGCRVIIIEPSRWLGGMTGGGLMHIDWGRPEAVGGTTRKILDDKNNDKAYRQIFADLVTTHGITVIFEHRLAAVTRLGRIVTGLTLDFAPPDRFGCPRPHAQTAAALLVEAQMFIDCSYEGDLMARAGVTYTYGRESAEQYGESLGGVPPNMAVYPIDPYIVPGNPQSGLLPLLQAGPMAPLGSADKLTMGYGFRWKFTVGPEQLPIDPPADYDPRTFELYRRAFRQKIDTSGRRTRALGVVAPERGHVHILGSGNLARSLVAPTVFGSNAGYPDGDWPTRARIWKFHQDFMRGMTHFLKTDPDAPADLKDKALKVGFQIGSFDETGGWPHQMYIREARRLVAATVVTQKDLAGKVAPSDSVGLASYGVDDWPYAMFALQGQVALNGGEFSMLYLDEAHQGIYAIPYPAITPRITECENLLVPVCCSASHIAMTSIRMEPVWMILGESAGVAAALAIQQHVPIQKVPYAHLRSKLIGLNQRLDRPS
jgi:hypothetical protein